MSEVKVKITPEIRARLIALQSEHGQLTPRIVVNDAKRKSSPLHGLFDWDVKSAAMKYWLHQARVIIHSVRLISSETETVTIQAPYYVRDPRAEPSQQGYVAVATLQKDPDYARESLRLEFSRVESALTRARSIAAVLGLEAEIDALLKRVGAIQEQIGATKAA